MAQKPHDVTLDQMLMALVKENPQAFINGNVNLLKAGATLRFPGAEDAAAIAQAEAARDIAQQNREFDEYRRRIAQVAPFATGSTGRLGLPKSKTATSQPAEPRSRLTLSNQGAVLGQRQITRDLEKQAQRAEQVADEIKALAASAVSSSPASAAAAAASGASAARARPGSQPARRGASTAGR